MAQQLKPLQITDLNEVGRYAVGMHWSDGHESIFPLDNLRRYCPCLTCRGEVKGELSEDSRRLHQLMRLGDAAVFLNWRDGHETIYTLPQLRALCRCAYCAGEPEKPITGG
jgi:DUF971 family protein